MPAYMTRLRVLSTLSLCLMLTGCAQPPPQVSSRDLSMGLIKVEVEGAENAATKDLRAAALEMAARRTIEKQAAYFVIADELHGTRYKTAQSGDDFGVAPSYSVLDTSTRERMDMGRDPDSVKTVVRPFVGMTIETFRRKPSDPDKPVFDARLLLSLASETPE